MGWPIGAGVFTSRKSSLAATAFAAAHLVFLLGVNQSLSEGLSKRVPVEGLRPKLTQFFTDTGPHTSGIARNDMPTFGNSFAKGASGGPLLPVYGLEMPRKVSAEGAIPGYVRLEDRSTGWLVIACVGTGCAFRIPIIYTEHMLESVRLVMAMAIGSLDAENAEQELKGLEAAAAQMEHLLAAKLSALTPTELEAYRVRGSTHDPWTQDCVDQAANGLSYAIVWAENRMMRFHRPYYPGFKSGAFPHFYARLERVNTGEVFAFDLHHRREGIGQGAQVHAVLDPKKGAL
jgi:hypothetical protein